MHISSVTLLKMYSAWSLRPSGPIAGIGVSTDLANSSHACRIGSWFSRMKSESRIAILERPIDDEGIQSEKFVR